MLFIKIRNFCRWFRIIVGSSLVVTAFITVNYWFFLGVIPIIAGMINFCPLCIISKKCDITT